jgi:hypothetical protein
MRVRGNSNIDLRLRSDEMYPPINPREIVFGAVVVIAAYAAALFLLMGAVGAAFMGSIGAAHRSIDAIERGTVLHDAKGWE